MGFTDLFVDLEYILRIIVASICGCIIGYERKNRNKEAGMKTHAIVALGSALIMIVSKYGFLDVAPPDTSRIAAQVVSGIGFLGTGVIFVRNNNIVSGLTTAAGIWATSGIGLCVGAGNYFVGIMSTIIMIALQEILHSKLFTNDIIQEDIIITMKNDKDMIPYIEEQLKIVNIEINFYEVKKVDENTMQVEANLLYRAHSYYDRYEQIKNIFLQNDDIISYKIQY
jgi:putative Mg2+ transporter-C (MgtC) family protein